jgi:hypothetical protein
MDTMYIGSYSMRVYLGDVCDERDGGELPAEVFSGAPRRKPDRTANINIT